MDPLPLGSRYNPKVQKAISIARNVSVTKAPVLIVGEIGVGKKVLAEYIHKTSNRINQPFEIIDCNSDPKLAENKILGYRDESTGRFNKGVLEVANNGTVVFANIDSLEDSFQKRLHKILNDGAKEASILSNSTLQKVKTAFGFLNKTYN